MEIGELVTYVGILISYEREWTVFCVGERSVLPGWVKKHVAPKDTCALRLEIEVGHSGTPASVRHSVWKRRMRSFSCVDRVGVALERCPGIPSFWQLARTR